MQHTENTDESTQKVAESYGLTAEEAARILAGGLARIPVTAAERRLRDAECAKLRLAGLTYDAIAESMGLSSGEVARQAVVRVTRALRDEAAPKRKPRRRKAPSERDKLLAEQRLARWSGK